MESLANDLLYGVDSTKEYKLSIDIVKLESNLIVDHLGDLIDQLYEQLECWEFRCQDSLKYNPPLQNI